MAKQLSAIYQFMVDIARKERGVMLTIPKAMEYLNTAQLDCYEDWFKVYGQNNEIHEALLPFKKTVPFASNSSGFIDYPADAIHLLTMYKVLGSTIYQIRWVNEDELVNALASQLRPVSTTKPIARDDDGGIQVYPQSSLVGTMIYLKRPTDVNLAYTQVGRTITYDDNASTQFEFLDVYVNNIIARALLFVGVNMSDQEVAQFSQLYQKETE